MTDAQTFLARHFVAISVNSRIKGDHGPDRFFVASGLLIRIGDILGILTAGHVVEYIDEAVNHPDILSIGCQLLDTFGDTKLSDLGVPYDLKTSPRLHFHNDEQGLDFGVLFLHEHQARLIEKHNIIPLTYEASRNEPADLDVFFLLGLPAELTSERVSPSGNATVGMTMLRLKKVEAEEQTTLFPRFIATIDSQTDLQSLEGMSGGPIFGFNTERLNKYWIVAIQSSWKKSERKIFGCPVTHIYDILNHLHDEAAKELAHKS
ncbi:hypothetical protein ELH75_23305 [Rhizobium leguminosarum]|jgi:hypothetical protein|uniref:hypothetical protein n=1 Tax=Rhizobium leguminosarum TaxID=384 RepID=UPI00102F7E6E|nr:hypothetical protein [Rhizobium leguminosarum]QIO73666.1 hypothetical protein HA459_17255 [Rhizobium leguminosarum bv. trifolii]QIO80685.1 hypothetical protein HA460_17295 [Rhizobium leguminosarum bv. trifolii]TAU22825.1 hypothetical protein ELI50_20575 [Rhizobium leguminosarum]TAU42820.1 hypothetical protein ELI51_21300 [Rhizobium leguminosarum]TAV13233.1 hypothetical protein ELI37_23330 [Rhizobium leguminosarum]